MLLQAPSQACEGCHESHIKDHMPLLSMHCSTSCGRLLICQVLVVGADIVHVDTPMQGWR